MPMIHSEISLSVLVIHAGVSFAVPYLVVVLQMVAAKTLVLSTSL